ncbi:hypothetical protein MRX96_025350 [Rhipicephalus microplus]
MAARIVLCRICAPLLGRNQHLAARSISTTPSRNAQFCNSAEEAIKEIKSGSKLLVGGFATMPVWTALALGYYSTRDR